MDLNLNNSAANGEINDESSSDMSSLLEFLNSSSSSTSSSEFCLSWSDDGEKPSKLPKVSDYLELVEQYTDAQFKTHFRLARNVAQILIDMLDKYIIFYNNTNINRFTNAGAAKEVYIMLWFLANTETYRQIGDRFDMSVSSVHRILFRVVKWIVKERYNYIKWPTVLEMKNTQIQFQMKKGLPNVIGAIDGSHVKINGPKRNKEAYCNRKKFYSLLLQGIVDADKKFIDIHAGEPGSIHDARLLRKSNFYRRIIEDDSIIVPGGVLLGDSAYPHNTFIVTPFKDFGNLTAKQLKFNYIHSSTRMVVENAFGLLKGRFRRLKFFESPNLGFVTNCIVAACVLHNICIMENDFIDVEYLQDEVNNVNVEQHTEENQANSSSRQQMFEYLDNAGLLE